MAIIDKNSRTPLYSQLMEVLISKIEGSMNDNDQLPSEREICETYDLSRTTVRQALDELEKEKYIYKVHGRGTFVSPKRYHQDLISFYSFTEEMRKAGKNPKSEVIGFELRESGEKLASIFKQNKDDLVYKIIRIRKADEIPMMYEVTYLPFERFKGLTKEKLEENPMYEIFLLEYNARITSAEEVFEPILTNKLESVHLGIDESSPSLKIERFTHEGSRIIEYTVGIARGDKFKYRVQLSNTK